MKITLNAARVNAGYNQEQVANMLEISKQTLINYEKGYTPITVDKLQKLVTLYKLDINDIELPKRKIRKKRNK